MDSTRSSIHFNRSLLCSRTSLRSSSICCWSSSICCEIMCKRSSFMLLHISCLSASRSNLGGGGPIDTVCALLLGLLVLVVCSVVTELVVEAVAVVRGFIVFIFGNLLGLNRY